MPLTCANCATENPDQARFCLACGSPIGGRAEVRRERKFVAMLFADLVGSTSLGEREDPEVVQDSNQTGGLVNFGISFLNSIPVIELVIAVVVIVGSIYYFGFQKRKPYSPVVVPDDTAPVGAAVPAASAAPAAPPAPDSPPAGDGGGFTA